MLTTLCHLGCALLALWVPADFGTAGSGIGVASYVYCVDSTGKQVWRYSGGLGIQGPYAESPTINEASNLVFIGSGDKYVLALTMDKGSVNAPGWTYKTGALTTMSCTWRVNAAGQVSLHIDRRP